MLSGIFEGSERLRRLLCPGVVLLACLGLAASAEAEEPAASPVEEGGFFDLNKLKDAQTLTFRGYLDAEFINAQGEERSGLPSFDQASATFFIGAPIYEEKVYASIALEFLNISRAFGNGGRRIFVFEEALIALKPLQGLTLSAGGFLVPFGLEDERHSSVLNPLISRPEAMAGGLVYPGSWIDLGAQVSWTQDKLGTLVLYAVNGDLVNQRLTLRTTFGVASSGLTDQERVAQELHALGLSTSADNNASKSYGGRLSLDGLDGLDVGISGLLGHYDEDGDKAAWALAAHLEMDLSVLGARVFADVLPLPTLLGEVARVVEAAPDEAGEEATRWGLYAQLLQPLPLEFSLVFRYEYIEPDDAVFDDEVQAFATGLRWELYPNTLAKLEYRIRDENRPDELDNNLFALQLVAGW